MKRPLLLICCICLLQTVFAKHIVGGAFSLQHISGTKYKLTLKVLRDCFGGGADFDDPAIVGVFDKKTNVLIETYHLNLTSQSKLDFAGSNCNNGIPNTCTSLGIYTQTITLSSTQFNNNDGYYFSYERCCRNNIITNILNPGDAAIAIYMEIPPPRNIINSTPTFAANPNTYLCVGSLTRYNLNFTDADGDVLKYSFVNPLNGDLDKNNVATTTPVPGPYSEIAWAGAHSTNQQIIGSPSLGINSSTGEVSVSPLMAGVYVVAIRVEEFRLGIKIGEVRLDLQFNVMDCPQPIPQIIVRDTLGNLVGNSFLLTTPQKLCFDIDGIDNSDSVFLTVNNISPDTNISSKPTFIKSLNGFKKVTNRVCWDATCDITRNTSQQLRVEVLDNGCPLPQRSVLLINLNVIPMPLINPTDILCMTLMDDKATEFYWGDSTGFNPYFLKYNIYRSVNSSSYTILDSVFDKSIRNYTDVNTPNYSVNNYQYYMRAANKCNQEGPPSDTLGTFEQLKYIPDQQKLITATVFDNDKVKITWPKSYEKDFARYMIYKSKTDNTNYSLVQTYLKVSDTVYIDSDVDVNKYSYCYHVIMKDTCDNYGPKGLEACTILLKGDAAPFKNKLNWSAYNYWESGTANYEMKRKGNESDFVKSIVVAPENTDLLDDNLDMKSGVFLYYVIANQFDSSTNTSSAISTIWGHAQSQSNTIELLQSPLVYIPNAFTPNDDGINEVWDIRDLFVKDYFLSIYDKWGQRVFQTNSKYIKWNGVSESGVYEPTDVYIYKLTYTGYDGSSFIRQGNVTILR